MRIHGPLTLAAGGLFALSLLSHWQPWVELTFARLLYALALPIVIAATLAFAAFAVVAWILTRGQASTRWRLRLTTCAIILALGAVVLVLNVLLARGLPNGSFVAAFDASVWRDKTSSQHIPDDITPRQKMLGAAIGDVLKGGDKETIIAQLGPSEDDDYFASSGRDLIYRTGPQRNSLFRIDSEWLLVWLDEQGKAERYEIRTD